MPRPLPSRRSCNTLLILQQVLLSLHVHPATAATQMSLTQTQLKEAEDLYELIRQRTGKDLPKLTSSPNVKASKGESIRSSLSASSLPSSFSEADAQSVAQLKAELEKINRELREKERLAESDKQELLKLEESLEQLRSSPGVASETEEGGGAFGFLNVMGILAAGGLGGYVFIQKNQAKSTQEELDIALTKEQKLVADLKFKAAAVQSSLDFEQEIVSKLKKEVSKIQQESSQLLSTEMRQKETAIREGQLANRALEAERNLVKAVRKETAAAQEQAQAERAAKFVAEAEAAAVSKQLKEAQEQFASQIEKERVLARKIGLDASKAMSQVKTMEEALGKAVVTGQALESDLARERLRGDRAEGEAMDLQRQLAQTEGALSDQQGLLQKVGGDTMSMRDAMSKLKQQSGDIALKVQREATLAFEARLEAEGELRAIQSELEAAKAEIDATKTEAFGLKSSLSASEAKVASLEADLVSQRNENQRLKEEAAHLQGQLSEAEQALSLEQVSELSSYASPSPSPLILIAPWFSLFCSILSFQATSKSLRQELKSVQAQLTITQAELEARTKEFESEKEQRAKLQASYQVLSSDLAKVGS